jgi:hypothetical protein
MIAKPMVMKFEEEQFYIGHNLLLDLRNIYITRDISYDNLIVSFNQSNEILDNIIFQMIEIRRDIANSSE